MKIFKQEKLLLDPKKRPHPVISERYRAQALLGGVRLSSDDEVGNRLSSHQWVKWLMMLLLLPSLLAAAPLEIITQNGSKKFEAELALTPQQQAKGLMFRTHLASDHGMLFLRDPNIPTAMWMKNTPRSLDMIFADEDGKIIHIEKMTTPFSKKIIGPIYHTRTVFEVVGGTCEKEEIQAGDTLIHSEL